MASVRIDLYSDTATKPTKEMREFMCAAEVGDEQRGEDPTVNKLQEMVAELLGKEAALFLPSGTMCNQIALAVHCRPGNFIILDRSAHPLISEAGGSAVLAGAVLYPIDGENGQFTAEQIDEAISPTSRYQSPVQVVSIEQTTNRPGGCIWPLEQMKSVCAKVREHDAYCHMDGARLLHATVATGIAAADYAAPFDSAWIDFSKGLGAPVGGALAGSKTFIHEAWQWKQRIGGAMRQAGIIAAAGIYALEHHVERLAEDHRLAKLLAERIASAPGISIDPEAVETNMCRFDVKGTGLSSQAFADRLLDEHGVRVSNPERTIIRAIPYLGISEADVGSAADAICSLANKIAESK
jgi:threonine aldolase